MSDGEEKMVIYLFFYTSAFNCMFGFTQQSDCVCPSVKSFHYEKRKRNNWDDVGTGQWNWVCGWNIQHG